jgi:hypothetical protein
MSAYALNSSCTTLQIVIAWNGPWVGDNGGGGAEYQLKAHTDNCQTAAALMDAVPVSEQLYIAIEFDQIETTGCFIAGQSRSM